MAATSQGAEVRTLIKEDFLQAFKQVISLASPTMPVPLSGGERINAPLSLYKGTYHSAHHLAESAISLPCDLRRLIGRSL